MRSPLIRTPGFARLLPLLAFLIATSAAISCPAQFYPIYPPFGYPRPYPRPHDPPPDPRDAPIEIGGHGMVGGGIEDTPPPHHGYTVGAIGLYAQWNRYGLCPGLDLRLQGNGDHLHGYLIGPRVAYQPRSERLRPFRLYAEGLFGKNEVTYSPDTSTSSLVPAQKEYIGTTSSIAIGLDLHVNAPVEWRVIEFSKGTFTGLHGSNPQTVMTGILIHFP